MCLQLRWIEITRTSQVKWTKLCCLTEDVNPSRLLSDLQGVYRNHFKQIENADEERDETYRVNTVVNF